MIDLYIDAGIGVIKLCGPEQITASVQSLLPCQTTCAPDIQPRGQILVQPTPQGTWQISTNGAPAAGPFNTAEIFGQIADVVAQLSAPTGLAEGTLLSASVVSQGQDATLILGGPASGKSILAAWMVDAGFSILSDGQCVLASSGDLVSGYAGLLAVPEASAGKVARLAAFGSILAFDYRGRKHFILDDAWRSQGQSLRPSMIILVDYDRQHEFSLTPLGPDAAMAEIAALYPRWGAGDLGAVAALLAQTPVVKISYGLTKQLGGVVDQLAHYTARVRPSLETFQKFAGALGARGGDIENANHPVPAPTPPRGAAKLTIGMATYDDYDGVYFSIQAMRLYHPEVLDHVEFVVIDNHPDGICGAALKRLEDSIPNYRYIPAGDIVGTAVRERIFAEAAGEFVLSMDSHVFFQQGVLRRLLDYIEANPDSNDLLQGPLVFDDLAEIATHFVPEWKSGMYGRWGIDPAGQDADAPPFDIPMQGLGVFACRRAAWPGFNARFRGFGGEEGYIHQKFRNGGARTLCLPFLRWVHRFERPFGTRYPNRWSERFRNYWIGWSEVGLPLEPMIAHFEELMNTEKMHRLIAELEQDKSA
ncbi:hypothetical protein GCM10007939_21120 [Amylibacter marinus]|uniref:Glycosyltransferase 2-like domain-containing protein n=1 Tax=Amylibacter marinus TaxID=1475483 RepID=A0ABQ5VWZ6_9RHOB|nr:glycosyltransferase [Amylibacter marinus]GLQ35829.1 hypothetical protein GCM10007939_21120 [Amylibacter marinus]